MKKTHSRGGKQAVSELGDLPQRATGDSCALLPWLVVSPEYGTVVPIVDGQGPMEYGSDVVFVEAENRRDALVLGVELFRQQDARYLHDVESPYAGVRVESQVCQRHGMPVWVKDHYECPACEEEAFDAAS